MAEVGMDALGLLTVPEVAALLSLGKRTVWRKVACGEIESVKDGRSRRIPRAAVADYIASLRAASGSQPPSGGQAGVNAA